MCCTVKRLLSGSLRGLMRRQRKESCEDKRRTEQRKQLSCLVGVPTRKCGYVYSLTNNFCVLHNTVEHNYISPSSTVGIQLHVSALYVGHLQVVI